MKENEVPEPIRGQLSIDVPSSPGAIGRWTADDEIAAYARQMGVDKTIEQKQRAAEARICNCGVQAQEEAQAKEEERREKRMPGHLHKPGCPCLRLAARGPSRISNEEQIRRYADSEGGS